MKKALFIFRRDLRLEDNLGLIAAMKAAEEVIPAFIFTPEQIENNPYRGDRSLQFMIESLEELSLDLKRHGGKLFLFYGDTAKIVEECIQRLSIGHVFVNRDYTPYSIERDLRIKTTCREHRAEFHSIDDLLLHPVEDTLKDDGTPYTVFTPYFRNASKLPVSLPVKNPYRRFFTKEISFAKDDSFLSKILPKRSVQSPGGRKACLDIIDQLPRFARYATERDFPAENKTTHLSPHLKFTTCSVREIYHAISAKLGKQSELIRALYWRDFFTTIAFHFPHVFTGAFKEKYDKLKWNPDPNAFGRWCDGTTGFPIVDAGMRELNATGFMHNRVRMITASFLVKDLHINWRNGERYFAQKLIDYDPAVNNGNWQWCASTGCDAQPYFRIFNPWSQSAKFDPNCRYIKQWIPELQDLSEAAIHSWHLEKNHPAGHAYQAPMVDHSKEASITLASYRGIAG